MLPSATLLHANISPLRFAHQPTLGKSLGHFLWKNDVTVFKVTVLVFFRIFNLEKKKQIQNKTKKWKRVKEFESLLREDENQHNTLEDMPLSLFVCLFIFLFFHQQKKNCLTIVFGFAWFDSGRQTDRQLDRRIDQINFSDKNSRATSPKKNIFVETRGKSVHNHKNSKKQGFFLLCTARNAYFVNRVEEGPKRLLSQKCYFFVFVFVFDDMFCTTCLNWNTLLPVQVQNEILLLLSTTETVG